MAKGKKGQTVN